MSWLGVIGNVSLDTATYPGGASYRFVGGAALHVALAASRHRPAAPVSVVGDDLAWLLADERLAVLDRTSLSLTPGPSCSFGLRYDDGGHLMAIDCDYGVAIELTDHALAEIGRHDRYHVCCRRPLDVERVLSGLTHQTFTLDFYVSSAAGLVERAAPWLREASVVFVDTTEAELLTAVVDLDQLRAVVISDGPREARLLRCGQVVARVEPAQTMAVEVTGAGDTLAGTFLARRAADDKDEVALRHAVEAATASVQQTGLAVPASPPR